MPKAESEGLQKVTLNLVAGDMERLRTFFPDVGASVVVRRLVHQYVKKLEGEVEVPQINVEIEE